MYNLPKKPIFEYLPHVIYTNRDNLLLLKQQILASGKLEQNSETFVLNAYKGMLEDIDKQLIHTSIFKAQMNESRLSIYDAHGHYKIEPVYPFTAKIELLTTKNEARRIQLQKWLNSRYPNKKPKKTRRHTTGTQTFYKIAFLFFDGKPIYAVSSGKSGIFSDFKIAKIVANKQVFIAAYKTLKPQPIGDYWLYIQRSASSHADMIRLIKSLQQDKGNRLAYSKYAESFL